MSSVKRGLAMIGFALGGVILLAVWVGSTGPGAAEKGTAAASPAGPGECVDTLHSLEALQGAVADAGDGGVLCLAAGSYGALILDGPQETRERVIVRAVRPGGATLAGADIGRSQVTLARFVISGGIEIEPGTSGVTVAHNHISGGYLGVDAGPTTTTTVNDVPSGGNKFVGPFGEGAIRLNRYHDANGDGAGALIANNEFTNIRENGNHSDCLQTVWVGDHLVYRGNYLHDNRCQGFFVKDQASLGGVSGPIAGITVENNLFVRNKEPCGPPLSSCGQPIYLQ